MSERREPLEPEKSSRPEDAADELLAHGLLEFLAADSRDAQARRVDSVMRAIPRQTRRTQPTWPYLAVAAAALVAVALVFSRSDGVSARALVRDAEAAERSAGDRRYGVRIEDARTGGTAMTAELDVRDPEHIVLRVRARPDDVVVVRRPDGTWAIGESGRATRVAGPGGPPMLRIDGAAVFAVPALTETLGRLQRGYRLHRSGREEVGGVECERVVATRAGTARGLGPDRVELCIEPRSARVHRMLLKAAETRQGEHGHEHAHAHDHGHGHSHAHGHAHSHEPRPIVRVEQHPGGAVAHAVGPHAIVFELVEATAAFPPGWFEPATHER